MKGLLLDTHAFLWHVMGLPGAFGVGAKREIAAADADRRLHIAAITLWEIAMLADRQRIQIPLPATRWLEDALRLTGVHVIPLDTHVAGTSGSLAMHGDPADRLIVASALVYNHILCTQDEKILAYAALHPELHVLPLRGTPE